MNKPRVLRLAGLALALSLAILGAGTVNRPLRPHGPFGFDALAPLGALALALGMLALRAVNRIRAGFALAALLIAAAAGWNFYFYPPIPDGAYFLVRYGHSAAVELWPAGAAWHVIATAALACSLALAIEVGLPGGVRRIAGEIGLLALLTIVGALLFDLLTQALIAAGGRSGLVWWLPAGMMAVAVGAGFAPKSTATRLVAAFAVVIALLAAATVALYRFA